MGGAMRQWARRVVAGLTVLLLVACAQPPVRPTLPQALWHDEAFAYDPALVGVSAPQLFQLDAPLLADLRRPDLQNSSVEDRMAHLLGLLFNNPAHAFAYGTGSTTVPAQTWASKRGDCLSLTLLTYAMARELKLPAQMQEVPVPALFDRRGEL